MRAVIVMILLAASVANATPTQDLDRARASFRSGDHTSALPVLNSLLYPDVQLVRQEEVIEAFLLLGAALYENGNRDRAVREFTKALQLDPDRSITTLMYSEGAVRLFEDTKRDFKARLEAEAERRRLAEERQRLQAAIDNLRVVETRPYFVNFLPFGAGQFQNGQRGKGLFFASAQGVSGAVSAGIWLYLASKYGLGGTVPVDETPTALRLQQVEVAAGALFIGFYGWSIVDALLNYKPRAEVEADPSLLPPELRPTKKPPPKKTSLRERLRFGPVLLPNGAGIGVSLENF